jgi:hypothetical protein
VKGGLCAEVADYNFSTCGGQLGRTYLPVSLTAPKERLDCFVPQEFGQFENWLNSPHRSEESEAIKKALKQKIFAFQKRRTARKISRINL